MSILQLIASKEKNLLYLPFLLVIYKLEREISFLTNKGLR